MTYYSLDHFQGSSLTYLHW